MSDSKIDAACRLIQKSSNTVALTGAGVSTKSGIPDFRSPNGLWTKIDPDKFATINAFLNDPKGWWELALDFAPTILKAKPNPSHTTLAKLEKMRLLQWLVTQNVDGLHQKAGSKNVLEVHGSIFSATCTFCHGHVGRDYILKTIKKRQIPPMCPQCGGLLKLDAVFFGERLPPLTLDKAFDAARNCQLMLAIGTFLVVYPVAMLPTVALQSGAKLIIINQEPTPFDDEADIVFHAEAGETLTQLMNAMKSSS
jgi:NAD-dependent deacetylase